MKTNAETPICFHSPSAEHTHRNRAPAKPALWEKGRATKRLSFRIYAETISAMFALTRCISAPLVPKGIFFGSVN